MENLGSDDDDDTSDDEPPKDKKEKKQQTGNQSSSGSSDSSSDSSSGDSDDGEDSKKDNDEKAKPKASPKGKGKPGKARRPLVPLADLPESTDCPLVLWDAEKSFLLACKDKLQSWVLQSPQGVTCRGTVFENAIKPHADKPAVRKLPWQQVVDEAKKAAQQLGPEWQKRCKAWKLADDGKEPFDLKTEREALDQDFSKFDAALKNFDKYQATLEQCELDHKLDIKDVRSQKQALETRLYMALRCQALPEGIAKV